MHDYTNAPIDKPDALPHEPTDAFSLEELATYARQKVQTILGREKANAVDMWWLGKALLLAKAKLPHGQFQTWCAEQKVKKTVAWRARQLAKKATLEEAQQAECVMDLLLAKGIEKVPDEPEEDDDTPGTEATVTQVTSAEATMPTPEQQGTKRKGREKSGPKERSKNASLQVKAAAIMEALTALATTLQGPPSDDLVLVLDQMLEIITNMKGRTNYDDLSKYEPATLPV